VSLLIVVLSTTYSVQAQNQPQSPRPVGIDLNTAKRMMAAAEAQAAKQGTSGAIAIVDAVNGDLVAFQRLDGATQLAVLSAEGKARTALLFGVSTSSIRQAIDSGKPLAVRPTTPGDYSLFHRMMNVSTNAGGVLVMKDGKVVGAVGVGGAGGGARDDAVAQAAVDAIAR
jgi:glc operon protein GlcG